MHFHTCLAILTPLKRIIIKMPPTLLTNTLFISTIFSSPHVPSSENSNPSTSGLQQTDTQDKDSMRKNDDDTNAREKEKEGCISDWLSGGPMGSKGVVLVFRSCVLASRTPSMESTTKTVGNNTGTTILLNKAKNMARRLVAEPHSFSMRPANIMHDVMETFGNTTKYTGQAYVVRHVSDAEVPETVADEEQGHEPVEHKRDIEDVLNDLSKITLKKHLNIENTTANIKPPEEPPPPECSKGNYIYTFVYWFHLNESGKNYIIIIH